MCCGGRQACTQESCQIREKKLGEPAFIGPVALHSTLAAERMAVRLCDLAAVDTSLGPAGTELLRPLNADVLRQAALAWVLIAEARVERRDAGAGAAAARRASATCIARDMTGSESDQ